MSSLRSEILAGVYDVAPLIAAAMPFGLIYGQQAVDKGLSPLEVVAMSSIVFAGSAQIVAVSLWQHPVPVAALALATFLINLRHTLMGASLATKIAGFGRWRYLAAFLMTDEAWVATERRSLAHPIGKAYYFSAALALFGCWQISSTAGVFIGRLIARPEVLGLDYAFPAIFLAMALGFWRGLRRTGPVILAAGVVAVAVHRFAGGAWYVVAGALAGIAAAAVAELITPSDTEATP